MMDQGEGDAAQLIGACCRDWHAARSDNGSVTITGTYVFQPSFHGFSGHFPGKPILPAVIQLLAVRSLLETALGQSFRLRSVDRTRFKAMILPEEIVAAEIALAPAAHGWHGSFSLRRPGAEMVASGNFDIAVQD